MRQTVLELPDQRKADLVLNALEGYKARLRLNIAASRRALEKFEKRHGVTTDRFLEEMTAEDLEGGDVEYIEWAGEAKLMSRLEDELRDLEDIRCEFH